MKKIKLRTLCFGYDVNLLFTQAMWLVPAPES